MRIVYDRGRRIAAEVRPIALTGNLLVAAEAEELSGARGARRRVLCSTLLAPALEQRPQR